MWYSAESIRTEHRIPSDAIGFRSVFCVPVFRWNNKIHKKIVKTTTYYSSCFYFPHFQILSNITKIISFVCSFHIPSDPMKMWACACSIVFVWLRSCFETYTTRTISNMHRMQFTICTQRSVMFFTQQMWAETGTIFHNYCDSILPFITIQNQ